MKLRTPIGIAALVLATCAASKRTEAQAPTVHTTPRLKALVGNVFYRASADGSAVLVSHSPNGEAEDLVVVPRDGSTETLWRRSVGRGIYNRVALSGNGAKVAYSRAPGGTVQVLDGPQSTPREIANVAPDGDVRQLVLSHDGALAAFTASSYRDAAGNLVRVRANLYVAKTDGSGVTKITSSPVSEKFIAFALSGDGSTLVWVDDAKQGAWVGDADGKNAKRLPAAPGGRAIQAVFTNAAGSTIYYQSVGLDGVKLHAVDRAQETVTLLHEGAHGSIYALSADGTSVHRLQTGSRTATWWRATATGETKVADVSWPRHLGSWTWSGDAGTLVWCGGAPSGGATTYVLQPAQP